MKHLLRERPVSLSLAVLLLVAAIATGSLVGPSDAVRAGAGLDPAGLFGAGRVLSLLTSVLLAGNPAELLLVLAAVLLVVGACERVLGSRRTVLAWVATAAAGGLLGSGAQAAGLLTRALWTTPPLTQSTLHPETPVLGVLLTASALAGPLWRRRIRLLGFTALAVLLLYSGQPEDLYHLAGALAGLGLGALLARRRPRLEGLRSSHQEARALAAAATAVGAIGPLVAVVQPVGYGLLRPLGRLFRDPAPPAQHLADRCGALADGSTCARVLHAAALGFPGTVLLALLPLAVLLAASLLILRGRLLGVWLAVGVNALLAVLGAVYYGLLPVLGDPDGARDLRDAVTLQSLLAVLVPLGSAVIALVAVRHCPVRPPRRTVLAASAALGAALVASAVVWTVAGLAMRQSFLPVPGPLDLLAAWPERLVPVGFLRWRSVDPLPAGPLAGVLAGWVGVPPWLTLLVAALVAGGAAGGAASPRDRARLRALLRSGGAGSISWMATWPGNRTWFSPDGRHAVAYREGAGVALAVGEPAGAEDGRLQAARDFAVSCADRGLVPAFYAVEPAFAAALAPDGVPWAVVEVGEDTVIDPATFSMRGKHWADVRSSINRAERQGVRAVWTDWASLPLVTRSQIEAISEEWIADKRLPELGFTLGGVEELRDREVRLMLAVDADDRVQGVTSWLPTWRDDELRGLTLDFMRRRPESMNGVMEFLIAAVIGTAQGMGLEFVSLSVAPLSGVGDQEDDGRLERLLAAIARSLEPVYGFSSLAAYKEKFRPEHRPQVLAHPDAVSLPAITVAVARAHLPDRPLSAMLRAVQPSRAEAEPASAPAHRGPGG